MNIEMKTNSTLKMYHEFKSIEMNYFCIAFALDTNAEFELMLFLNTGDIIICKRFHVKGELLDKTKKSSHTSKKNTAL